MGCCSSNMLGANGATALGIALAALSQLTLLDVRLKSDPYSSFNYPIQNIALSFSHASMQDKEGLYPLH